MVHIRTGSGGCIPPLLYDLVQVANSLLGTQIDILIKFGSKHTLQPTIKGQVFPSKGGWSAPDYSYSLAYTILYIKGAVSAESQSQSNKIISYVVAWPISVVKPSMRLKSIFKYVTF